MKRAHLLYIYIIAKSELASLARSFYICVHETPLTWKETIINNANLFSPNKVAKNNNRVARV